MVNTYKIGVVNSKSSNFNIQVFIFCLIILQSVGIRFFNGQGTLLSVIVIALSFNNLKKINIIDLRLLFFAFLFSLVSKIGNESLKYTDFIYQLSIIFSSYIFLVGYRNKIDAFQKDFFYALELFVYHAVIGFFVFFVFKNHFVDFEGTTNRTFYNMFYVSNSYFGGFPRNTGLFWEPGVFQLVANFYLFYCIKFNGKIGKIVLGLIAVLSTFSTTGLFILLINIAYFIYIKWKEKKIHIFNIVLILSFVILFIPILRENAEDKISETNTSGLARLRDYYIGIELIKEKPLLGHGVFNVKYLSSKSYVRKLETNLFSVEFLDITGEMGGGFTNGLLALIAWYGIPLSFILYFFYYKNRFIGNDFIERLLFNLIMLITLISEPIANTSLFLMFPFSYWVMNKEKSIRKPKNLMFNNFYLKKPVKS
jgi:hypothetical protein